MLVLAAARAPRHADGKRSATITRARPIPGRGPRMTIRRTRMDTSRRQFLSYSTALLATTAGAAPALAQGAGGLTQSGLVGNLEGSEVVTDPARMPRTFKEAPEL